MGDVTKILSYDAYGIPNENNAGRFGYTGQILLKELNLNYYKARFYSSTLGRFSQTDPIGYKDNMNMYAYVGNDPFNKKDPTGMYGRGDGFSDKEWEKFSKDQQKTAAAMEKRADKMTAKADKMNAKNPGSGDKMRDGADKLRAGAANLRSDGSDGKFAHAVNGTTYQNLGGTSNGGAFVPRNDRNLVYINIDNKSAWRGPQALWSIGHESLHGTGAELVDQRGSNGEKAYIDGDSKQRDAYEELKGTDKAYINPDHLMDLVY